MIVIACYSRHGPQSIGALYCHRLPIWTRDVTRLHMLPRPHAHGKTHRPTGRPIAVLGVRFLAAVRPEGAPKLARRPVLVLDGVRLSEVLPAAPLAASSASGDAISSKSSWSRLRLCVGLSARSAFSRAWLSHARFENFEW